MSPLGTSSGPANGTGINDKQSLATAAATVKADDGNGNGNRDGDRDRDRGPIAREDRNTQA